MEPLLWNPWRSCLTRSMLVGAKEDPMLYIAVLAVSLLMAVGSVVFVMTGQHSGKLK